MSLASPRRPLSPNPAAGVAGAGAMHSPVPGYQAMTPPQPQQHHSPHHRVISFQDEQQAVYRCTSSPSRRPLQRQFSTSRPDSIPLRQPPHPTPVGAGREPAGQVPAGPPVPMPKSPSHQRRAYPAYISRSTDACHLQPQVDTSHHSRTNSYPVRSRPAAAKAAGANCRGSRPPRRCKQRPPPLKLGPVHWESGQTSETDCSVASSTSPPHSSSSAASPAASPSPASSTSPHITQQRGAAAPSSHYFNLPPLSPIPPSPQPSMRVHRAPRSPTLHPTPLASPRTPPRSPRSPGSTRNSTRNASPCPSPGYCRSPSPVFQGNLARLASRRRSNAVTGFNRNRRTSNFLELPETDYERQRRYCSLPEQGYNPRNEIYKLRAFSISPKGALIKHGDQIASRRSKSSNGSTANTSRTPSRNASPFPSHPGSRDLSPMPRSPVHHHPSSPYSAAMSTPSQQQFQAGGIYSQSRPLGEEEDGVGGVDEEDETVKYRVCMLGGSATGKTSLVSQFLTSEYMNTYDASLDEEFGERSVGVSLDGDESEMVFIDHSHGEMSVENTLSTYDPHACVIVYSVVDRSSFQLAEEVLGYLWRIGYTDNGRASIILVANKVDLERSRVIQQEEGKKLAMSFGAKFIETSVGIQHNVDELLVGTLKQIRLHEEDYKKKASKKAAKKGNKAGNGGSDTRVHEIKRSGDCSSSGSKGLSSPLHTLQVARDILAKVCLNATHSNLSKSCENLHVL